MKDHEFEFIESEDEGPPEMVESLDDEDEATKARTEPSIDEDSDDDEPMDVFVKAPQEIARGENGRPGGAS